MGDVRGPKVAAVQGTYCAGGWLYLLWVDHPLQDFLLLSASPLPLYGIRWEGRKGEKKGGGEEK